MTRYEYIRLYVDPGDLSELNSLGSVGWHIAAVIRASSTDVLVLLERKLGGGEAGDDC